MEVRTGRDSSKITKEDLKKIFEESLTSINLNILIQNYIQLISGDDEMMEQLVDYVVKRVPTETVECYLLLRDILQIDKEFQKAALRKFKNHKAVVENLCIIKAIGSADGELLKLAKEVASLLCRNANYNEIFEKMFTLIPLDQIGSTARIEKSIRPIPRKSNRNYLGFDSQSTKKNEHGSDSATHAVMPRPAPGSRMNDGKTSGMVTIGEERTRTGTYVAPTRSGEILVDDTDSSSTSDDDTHTAATTTTTATTKGTSVVIGSRTGTKGKTNKRTKTNIIEKIEGDDTEVTKVETFTFVHTVKTITHHSTTTIRGGTTVPSQTDDSHKTKVDTTITKSSENSNTDGYPTGLESDDDDDDTTNPITGGSTSDGSNPETEDPGAGDVGYYIKEVSIVMKAEIPLCTEDSPKLLISIDDNPANNKPIFDIITEDKGAGIIVKTFSSSVEFKSFVTRNIRTLMSYRGFQDKIRFMTDGSRVEVAMTNTMQEDLKAVQDNHAYKNVISLVRDEIHLDKAKILIYTGSGIGNIKLLHSPTRNLFVTWFQDIAFQFAYFSDEIDYRF